MPYALFSNDAAEQGLFTAAGMSGRLPRRAASWSMSSPDKTTPAPVRCWTMITRSGRASSSRMKTPPETTRPSAKHRRNRPAVAARGKTAGRANDCSRHMALRRDDIRGGKSVLRRRRGQRCLLRQSYTGLAPLQSPDRAGYLRTLPAPHEVLHEGDFVGASISGSDCDAWARHGNAAAEKISPNAKARMFVVPPAAGTNIGS